MLDHQVSIVGDWIHDIYDGTTGKLLFTYGNTQKIADLYGVAYRGIGNVYVRYGQGLFVAADQEDARGHGESSKYGFMDRSGHMIIPSVFEQAVPFSNGYAWVEYNGLWGVIKLPTV